MYKADGIAKAVDFTVHAAIRSCQGAFQCPDEDTGCPGTKWALCAIASAPVAEQISFIGCWDDQNGEDWEANAKQCASAGKMDFSKVSECAKGGEGTRLQATAADAFKTRFPDKPCGGIFGVPHIEINGKTQANPPTYKGLLNNLCASGITAGACKTEGNGVVV